MSGLPMAVASGVFRKLGPASAVAAVYLATLGISAFQYAPYCFLAIINPLISILYAFTGWTLAPLDPSKPIKKSITVEEMNQS